MSDPALTLLGMTTVILNTMKTAISLPDQLFRQAEDLARHLGIPRSQLYARALTAYLEAQAPSQITAALDGVYGEVDSSLDPALAAIQATIIAEETE